jgi:predicted metal-dependent hydrolase
MSPNALRERPPHRFDLGDEVIDVRVRESSRARTTRVIVGPRRPLEVIVARGTSDSRIDAFLESKRRWITDKIASARAIAARPAQLGLERPGIAWLGGDPLPLERLNGRRAIAELVDGRVVLRGPADAVPAALERWYRREARRRILDVVERDAARLGLEFNSIGIRDPKTRWGSCSRRGNLSFSWRLLLAPPEVLEYVAVHELLHLREPNHTKAFWRLVEAARPGWQEQARWLREHGQELHDFRPQTALQPE